MLRKRNERDGSNCIGIAEEVVGEIAVGAAENVCAVGVVACGRPVASRGA